MSGRKYTWPLPYLRAIETQLEPGQTVIVKGFIFSEGRFEINLATSENIENGDIIFHMSNRLDEGKIVFNSRKNNEWEKEDRHGAPFKTGEEFDIRIRAHQEQFEIWVNGKEFAKFEYRYPLSAARFVSVQSQCIELHHVSWEGTYFPIPFTMPIPGGVKPNQALYVSGAAEDSAKKFEINLRSGNDIVFHLNPRFGEKEIVRNSCTGGQWEKEEREGEFTLKKGRTFDIIISNKGDAYQVFVNGEPFCEFKHRAAPDSVQELHVDGDIQLQNVIFK